MRKSILAIASIASIAVAGVVAAPAGVASADSDVETIKQLIADGYTVNIDRVGSAAPGECTVTSVRNPTAITRLVRFGHGNRSRLIPITVSKTIQVSLFCD
ncbi:MAG: hypothetical protein K2X52_13255 [Mycobacteriaceae bacterium]|jgi:hypothetical protein|uniref:hypothetical protein n=1 Tax=Mycolicibacterium mucogenicum TaxID=56689 RepID=UPI00076A3460|nr:hypothetical protein [Mycolicibacterium mucogenicum]MBY0288102.1 hypothetical protein [Mycobacteriaceae bacterium]